MIEGLARAIAEEEASGELRIGQGVILYHRDLGQHLVLTLADMLRTGDDLGRFRLAAIHGLAVFGIHGSFILVRNDVAQRVGFDYPPFASVTEDAYFAMLQVVDGRRFRWVDGYLVEQSTRSVGDFIRQRGRWLVGLSLLARKADRIPRRERLVLGAIVLLWAISPLGLLYTYVNLFIGLATAPAIRAAGNFSFAVFLLLYLVGLSVNLHHRAGLSRWRLATLYFLQVVLIPVFGIMEMAGVLHGLAFRKIGFHVVKK